MTPTSTLTHDLDQLLAAAEAEDPTARLSVTLLRSDLRYDHREHDSHYAASTMKLPVLLAAYRLAEAGLLDLDAEVAVHNDFASVLAGRFGLDPTEDSDPEVWARIGSTASLRWLARRMTIVSSNLATDLVLDHVGLGAVAAALDACSDPRTDGIRVGRGIEDAPARDAGISNLVSTSGLAAVLAALQDRRPARPETCDQVLGVLAANESLRGVRPGSPPDTWIAHKSGWVEGVVHDAALVDPVDADPYVLVVCTTTGWTRDRAEDLVGAVARACWEHRNDVVHSPTGFPAGS